MSSSYDDFIYRLEETFLHWVYLGKVHRVHQHKNMLVCCLDQNNFQGRILPSTLKQKVIFIYRLITYDCIN